jgi:predicted nucleic acid-binding Zn ribbon protein
MDTKQCPYCGEEILAVAKKCKHCGEWLDKEANVHQKKMTECPVCAEEIEEDLKICPHCKEMLEKKQEVTRQEVTIENLSPPNYRVLSILCYVAVFFEVISGVQGLGLKKAAGGGIAKIITGVAILTPEWLTIICGGFLFIYLIMGLRKHYRMTHANKPIPFIALICLCIGVYFGGLIAAFAVDADEDVLVAIVIIAFLIAIPAFILQFIVGLQLKNRLKKAASIGVLMMISAIVPLIVTIVEIGLSEDEKLPVSTVIGSVLSIIFYLVLRAFFKKNIAAEQD